MRKVIMGAAAAAMLVSGSMAQAAPVASRTASPTAKSDQLAGGVLWLAILAAGLLAFILIQINENNNETLPKSP